MHQPLVRTKAVSRIQFLDAPVHISTAMQVGHLVGALAYDYGTVPLSAIASLANKGWNKLITGN